eukprot:scaffold5323_cov73-Phaeocystis_antarctica.AAC.2
MPLRLAVKVALAAGVACERRPGHAPAADNASLKLALRRSAWQPAEESMKTRSAMGRTGRASSNPIN